MSLNVANKRGFVAIAGGALSMVQPEYNTFTGTSVQVQGRYR